MREDNFPVCVIIYLFIMMSMRRLWDTTEMTYKMRRAWGLPKGNKTTGPVSYSEQRPLKQHRELNTFKIL